MLERIEHDRSIFAVMLGGPDRKTLFLLAADWPAIDRHGRVHTEQRDDDLAGTPQAARRWDEVH